MHIVIGLDTLTGTHDLPAELVGYGPIPADLARHTATDAVWKRLITDPLSGALLDHGRRTYRPPAALDDFVKARDVTCRFPICNRRAIDCDLDHLQRWADGGDTNEADLHGFCGQHHALKELPGWQVIAHPDGTLTWITPTGHRHISHPHDYRDYFPDDLHHHPNPNHHPRHPPRTLPKPTRRRRSEERTLLDGVRHTHFPRHSLSQTIAVKFYNT